jgi:hypothetical protein
MPNRKPQVKADEEEKTCPHRQRSTELHIQWRNIYPFIHKKIKHSPEIYHPIGILLISVPPIVPRIQRPEFHTCGLRDPQEQGLPDGCRKAIALIVIGVLPDQVNSAGRLDQQIMIPQTVQIIALSHVKSLVKPKIFSLMGIILMNNIQSLPLAQNAQILPFRQNIFLAAGNFPKIFCCLLKYTLDFSIFAIP